MDTKSLSNLASGAVFTKNKAREIESCITFGWEGLSGTNTLAYWAHS